MLQQLSVGKKLALAFTAVGVVMLGVAGVSYFGLRTIGALVVEVADIEASRSAHARDLERDVLELRRFEKEMALAVGDRARLESYAKQWREAYERTREGALRLDALLDDPTEKQDLARGMRNLRAHEQGMTEVLAELRDGKITTPSAANDAMKTHDESVRVVEELSRDLARAHEERMHAALPQVQARAREVSLELLALLCIGTLLSIAVTLGTTRSITTPLLQLTTAARRIASGDLSVEVSRLERKDEIGTLVEAFREMSINTQGLVRSLQEGVTQLSASASQIGATARQYAATAAEQAASVAEVSTTIDEINQTSQVAASSAREVAEGAEAASESGQLGRAKLGEAVEVIQTINERVSGIAHQIVGLAEQTSQIGTIVDAVNDLAEQSNLLAVNASIEAAKAGENGRGFAVVATEVRSLAEQSKRATQQIRTILGQIQKATQSAVMATEEGTKRAEDGRRAIEAVRVAVDDIGAVLEDSAVRGRQIAGTASQQASGVSQIASAIEGLARAGQDNAKGVKQLEQAVLDLGRLSLDLKTTSQRFRA